MASLLEAGDLHVGLLDMGLSTLSHTRANEGRFYPVHTAHRRIRRISLLIGYTVVSSLFGGTGGLESSGTIP